jgi:hypothetical protein
MIARCREVGRLNLNPAIWETIAATRWITHRADMGRSGLRPYTRGIQKIVLDNAY